MAKAKSCTPWTDENRPSGAHLYVRTCGNMRAEILAHTPTYNIYRDGKYVTRGSSTSSKPERVKAAATRAMARYANWNR